MIKQFDSKWLPLATVLILGQPPSGSIADSCSEIKVCFVTAVAFSNEEHLLYFKWTPIPFFIDGIRQPWLLLCKTFISDSLVRFVPVANSDIRQQAIRIDIRKPKDFPYFVWINTMQVKSKITLTRIHHAFHFKKYVSRYFIPFPNYLSRYSNT